MFRQSQTLIKSELIKRTAGLHCSGGNNKEKKSPCQSPTQVSVLIQSGLVTPILSGSTELKLISWKDRRCRTSAKEEIMCVWEGDFKAVFEVWESGEKLDIVILNSHDLKNDTNQWSEVNLGSKRLFLAGGPNHADGFSSTKNLEFQFSYCTSGFN